MTEALAVPNLPPSNLDPSFLYQSHLDMLYCMTMDVSYASDQIGLYLSLLHHPRYDAIVGFQIWGAKTLIRELVACGEKHHGKIRVASLIQHALSKELHATVRVREAYEGLISTFRDVDIAESALDMMLS